MKHIPYFFFISDVFLCADKYIQVDTHNIQPLLYVTASEKTYT